MAINKTIEMRSTEVEACPECGSRGDEIYRGVRDLIFGAPGVWNFKRCQSSDCGLVWINPRPDTRDLWIAYQKYYTHKVSTVSVSKYRIAYRNWLKRMVIFYLKFRFGYFRSFRIVRSLFGAIAQLLPTGRDGLDSAGMFLEAPLGESKLLEVGCGNGSVLATMKILGWTVEGVEFDPKSVSEVISKGIPCRSGSLEDQSYSDNSFDVIYAGNVVEHLTDFTEFLMECRRILKPQGRLIIVTPNGKSQGHRKYGRNWRGLEPPRHLQIFNVSFLGDKLVKHGFTVDENRTTNRGAWYILGMSMRIQRADERSNETMDLTPPRVMSLESLWIQYAARTFHVLAPLSGEELVIIAKKT